MRIEQIRETHKEVVGNIEESVRRKFIRDLKLKNGDAIPKGTSVEVKFLGKKNSAGETACYLHPDYTGKSGRNYMMKPVKYPIIILHKTISGFGKPPSMGRVEKMIDSGVATTPTGKRVEPDGFGPDGSPSWLLVLGIL